MTQPQPQKPGTQSGPETAASRELDPTYSLLKTNLEEIAQKHRQFFGTLKIELSFREGKIDTIAVERRQTFKN